jgi:bla regulator protein BlaR1
VNGYGWTESTLLHAAGWALIHMCWQAPVLAALARAGSDLLGPARPRGRYAMYFGGLVLVPCLAVATAFWIATVWPTAARVRFDQVLTAGPDALPVAAPALLSSVYEGMQRVLPWLALAWATLALPALVRVLYGIATARRLARGPAEPPPASWTLLLLQIGRRLSARADLAISGAVSVPSVVGVLRPRVLIPSAAAGVLRTGELASVLAHELAHVRRRDPLAGVVQAIIEALFWFHPAVRAMGRRARAEREHCCDDLVVRVVGNPLGWARTLAALEQLRGEGNRLVAAATDGVLLERVRRLLGKTEPTPQRGRAVLGGMLASAVLLAGCILLTAPYRHGAALPASLRPYLGSYTVQAVDPAGTFSVSVGAARLVGATIDGDAVPAKRLQQKHDSLHVLDESGGRLLSVALRPTGGITWNARPAIPSALPSSR